MLDSTKGKVSAYVGPYKNSLSDTDQLVQWDSTSKRFTTISTTDKAQMVWAVAGEGQYIVLTNPAPEGQAHPPRGTATEAVDLEVGKRIIVPGPATFPLWPGQTAETIEGHHLRHNQYVIARVYDAQQARDNWGQAVFGSADRHRRHRARGHGHPRFHHGPALIVIPGTQVSFLHAINGSGSCP